MLLAPRNGNILDVTRLASELGVNRVKVYNYLEFLEGTFFLRLLPKYSSSIDRTAAGEFSQVLDDLSIVVRMEPDDQQAWYLRGRARTFLDDDEGAIEDYNRALDPDPEYDEALLYRGIGRFQQGDVEGPTCHEEV